MRDESCQPTGGRAPGYRLSQDHFQTVKRMLAPDWTQKMLSIIVPNRQKASLEVFSRVRTRLLLSRILVRFVHAKVVHARESFIFCFPNHKIKHFLCPIRSLHSLDRLKMVGWESVPRGSSARAWKLSSRLSQTQLTAPGSSTMMPLLKVRHTAWKRISVEKPSLDKTDTHKTGRKIRICRYQVKKHIFYVPSLAMSMC